MIRRILIAIMISMVVSACFAGYSSGGRSGFSAARSYSAPRTYTTVNRSGYAASSRSTPTYIAPRSYSSSPRTTVVNNHYSSGHGMGFGGGFFSGMLGGYLGGTLASGHNSTVIAGGQVMPQGQGMLMEQGYVQPSYGMMSATGGLISFIGFCLAIMFIIWLIVKLYRTLFEDNHHYRNRW